jgi:hypothetical protein
MVAPKGNSLMNILGALLAILNIVTILGPVAGVAVMYQNNLQATVIPPQIQDLINGGNGNLGSDESLFSGASFQLPQFVSATADTIARSVTINLNFTNPLNYDLNLNSITADIVCQEHNFTLGHANLVQPTILRANITSNLEIVCQWTLESENHFLTDHAGALGVDVNIVGLTIDVNGITIQSSEPYSIPNLPISDQIAQPQYISAVPDLATHSATITFNFTNPFAYDLNINSVSADIVCSAHNFLLGHASLANPVTIPASSTTNFQIICSWTQAAEDHFTTDHPNATSIDVDVTGLTVNANNITIQAPTSYHVPNVPLS